MGSSLRVRILLTLLPLLILIAGMGTAGVLLLHRLGEGIDVILRDNYESVVAMQELTTALERIDSSLRLLLIVQEINDPKERDALHKKALEDYARNWNLYQIAYLKEQENVTIFPEEDILFKRLRALTERYRRQADDFLRRGAERPDMERKPLRFSDYVAAGLEDSFTGIKQTAENILRLNQEEMVKASDAAKVSAARFAFWLAFGLALAILLAVLFAWQTIRTILGPIQALTDAAHGISAGHLDEVVPYLSDHELGKLALAFNTMAHHLRDYRQSHMAQLMRAQKTTQATIDSFPDAVIMVDSTGLVELANPAARNLLGIVPKQKGQAASGSWQPPEPLRRPLAEALEGQRDYLPEGFDRALLLGISGGERAYLPRIVSIRDPEGQSLGAAVLLQDVTRLRLLDQIKSNLVATASHELKTPLTGIRLVVYLLLEEKVGPLSPKQIELLLDARDNSERLLSVVNNFLDLTRFEQGWRQLDLAPETPSAILQAAADAIRPRAQDKGIDVVLNVPPNLPAIRVDAPVWATL